MKSTASALFGLAFVALGVLAGGAETAAPVFPLKVSANGRYFADQRDRPFRLNCEAMWFMSIQATEPEVEEYLADREAKGFNSFILMAMVHGRGYTNFCPQAPLNKAGRPPHAVVGDFSSAPDEDYWRFIDAIVDRAAAHHMVVVLAYTYLGYQGGDEGWWQELNQPVNTREVCFKWGAWLGRRYRSRPNIIWYTCGDFAPPTGSEGAKRVLATIKGIKSEIPTALFGAEMNNPDQLSTDVPDFAPVMDMNSFYGYGPNFDQRNYLTAGRAWDLTPAKPAWVGEPNYYEDHYGGASGTRADTRTLQWFATLGGGLAGGSMAAHDLWTWTNWRKDLNSGYATDRQHLFAFFAALPWYELVPAGTGGRRLGRTLIVSDNPEDRAHIVAAATSSGTWLVAYVPVSAVGTAARTFAVDLTAMNGPMRARWFNPTSGEYTDIGVGLANAGSHEFTTPGDNGTGAGDWVLVVDAESTPK